MAESKICLQAVLRPLHKELLDNNLTYDIFEIIVKKEKIHAFFTIPDPDALEDKQDEMCLSFFKFDPSIKPFKIFPDKYYNLIIQDSDYSEFCTFFGINSGTSDGKFLINHISGPVMKTLRDYKVNTQKSDHELELILRYSGMDNKKDSTGEGIYPYAHRIHRTIIPSTGKPGRRSDTNTKKIKNLVPHLYPLIKDFKHISVCFSKTKGPKTDDYRNGKIDLS